MVVDGRAQVVERWQLLQACVEPTLPGTALFRATDQALRNRNGRRATHAALFWCVAPAPDQIPLPWRRIVRARYGGLRPVGLSQCVEKPERQWRREICAPRIKGPREHARRAQYGQAVRWVRCERTR